MSLPTSVRISIETYIPCDIITSLPTSVRICIESYIPWEHHYLFAY